MKAWIDALAPADQQVAQALLQRGCEFIWRTSPADLPLAEPFESEACWFEIWCGTDILSFLGPIEWPLSAECIQASGVFMFRQVEAMMRSKR